MFLFFNIGKEFSLQDEEKIASNGKDKFPIVYSYPKSVNINKIDKHLNKLMSMTNICTDFKVRSSYSEVSMKRWCSISNCFLIFFLKELNSSYYVCRIQENCLFFIIFESKLENKNKIADSLTFVQNTCNELNLNRVFQQFNPNLK